MECIRRGQDYMEHERRIEVPEQFLFNNVYKTVLSQLYHYPQFECSPRGMKIKEYINVNFTIDPRYPLMSCEERKTPLKPVP